MTTSPRSPRASRNEGTSANRGAPLIVLLMSVAVALSACDPKDPGKSPLATPAVDNTVRNTDYDRTKTATDQSGAASDIKLTADIRKAVIADANLSANAKNSKIITDKGMVTLRGAVDNQAEKDALEATAVAHAGAGHVTNQLEVKHP